MQQVVAVPGSECLAAMQARCIGYDRAHYGVHWQHDTHITHMQTCQLNALKAGLAGLTC